MSSRPSLWLTLKLMIAAALAVLLTVAVTSVVGARGPGTPTPVSASSFYWGGGPNAEYGSDFGSIGIVAPRRLTVPAAPSGATSYDALVTLGLQYRTRGQAPFTAQVLLSRAGTRRQEATKPRRLRLAATGGGSDSATLTFRVTGLEPGATYEVAPSVNASIGRGNAISTKLVVIDVALTPR